MRGYGSLAVAEFRRFSTYRAATVAGVVTNSVFGFIRVGVLIAAITAAGGVLGGYDVKQASTYVWLGQAFLAPISMYGWSDLAERVRTGDIAVDLARPIDLQLSWWARDLGRAAFALPTRGLAPLLVGALTVGLAFPGHWSAYPLGLLSLLLAISISFCCRYGMNLIAFWTVDVQGYLNFYAMTLGLLSGFGIALTVGLLAGAMVLPADLRWPSLAIALVLVGKACHHTIHPIPCLKDENTTSQEASRRSAHKPKSFTARRIKALRPHHHCLKQKRMLQSALQQHQGLNASMLKDVEDFKFKISTGLDEAKQQVDAAKTMAKEAVEAKSSIEKQFASAKEELKKQVEEAEAEAKRANEAKLSTEKELESAKQEVEEMKELVEKLKAEAAEQMKDVKSKMQAQLDEANATVDEERARFEPALKQQWIGGRLEMRSEMRNKLLAVKRQADEAKSAADKELAEARAALNEELEQAKVARADAQNAADALAAENEELKALLKALRSSPKEEAVEIDALQPKTATAPAPEDVQEVLATPDDQTATAAQESPVWDPAVHGLVVQPANASVARGIKKARNKVLGMGVAGFVKKWVGPKGCKPRVRAVKMLRVDNVPEGWRKHVEEWLEWEHGGFQSEFEMMERFKKNVSRTIYPIPS